MISIAVIILKKQGYLHYQSKWNSGENHKNQDSGILISVWTLTFKFKNGEKTTENNFRTLRMTRGWINYNTKISLS